MNAAVAQVWLHLFWNQKRSTSMKKIGLFLIALQFATVASALTSNFMVNEKNVNALATIVCGAYAHYDSESMEMKGEFLLHKWIIEVRSGTEAKVYGVCAQAVNEKKQFVGKGVGFSFEMKVADIVNKPKAIVQGLVGDKAFRFHFSKVTEYQNGFLNVRYKLDRFTMFPASSLSRVIGKIAEPVMRMLGAQDSFDVVIESISAAHLYFQTESDLWAESSEDMGIKISGTSLGKWNLDLYSREIDGQTVLLDAFSSAKILLAVENIENDKAGAVFFMDSFGKRKFQTRGCSNFLYDGRGNSRNKITSDQCHAILNDLRYEF